MGIVNRLGKGQKQTRHQEEHGNHTENNGLCQNNTHVIPNPKLHEHHCHHTGNGRQGTGRNLGNCLAQGCNDRIPGILILMLLHETMRQNNRIVHRQTKL